MKLALKLDTTPIPHCRLCGKAIAKRTRMIMFGQSNYLDERFEGKPTSWEEVAKYTNGKITSVRWSMDNSYIATAHVWDGETYVDEFFCTKDHAVEYARAVVRGRENR